MAGIFKKDGIIPPDKHGAEGIGLLDEEKDEKERINKNDPRLKPRKSKGWGMPFDKGKDEPTSRKYTRVEELSDADLDDNTNSAFNPVEAGVLDKIDRDRMKAKVKMAQKVLKFIEAIEPNIKDKELLKRYTQTKGRINPQGRWEASEEEIAHINDYILKLGLNSRFNLENQDLVKAISQMSPKKLADLKQKLLKDIESNFIDDDFGE